MKRIIKIILCTLSVILLSACADDTLLLQYGENTGSISGNTSITGDNCAAKLTPFCKQVCVVPKKDVNTEHEPELPASGLLMADITDNEIIYSYGIYDKLYPASLTKLATALVCLKYGNMNDEVKVSYNASHINVSGAKLCFLQEGDVINFETLLTSFIVYSGNDAGIALAEHISGSEKEFTKLMKQELLHLGATGTNFINSHGLPDDNHYTTAYDIYLILNELSHYEKFREISSMKEYVAEFKDASGNVVKKVYDNTNMYLSGQKKLPDGFELVAGKTGTTTAAGNCLSVIVKGPDSHEYIAVCMKAYSYDSLYSQINKLLGMADK